MVNRLLTPYYSCSPPQVNRLTYIHHLLLHLLYISVCGPYDGLVAIQVNMNL